MKYKVGNKVRIKSLDWYNENKNEYGGVDCGAFDFTYDMTKFCGKIVTIKTCYKHDCYTIKEDDKNYTFTGEMIEGLVEEEMKSENELLDEYEELTDRAFKGGYEKCKSDIELNGFQLPEGYIFKDDNGNEILTSKIILEKKKKEYPKTYEECSLINSCEDRIPLRIIGEFTRLINARNAYWKIAGEEMGLGKPWKPDYNEESYEQGSPVKYVIYYMGTHITKGQKCTPSYILSFPTEEMRDAFYENFKDLIEQCKELL